MSALLLTALLAVSGAAPTDAPSDAKGWVRPAKSDLTRVLGMRWKAELSEPPFLIRHPEEWTAPFISRDHGVVLAGSGAGELQARSMATGEVLWRKRNLGGLGASMAELQGRALFSSASSLVAVAVDTGQEKWRFDLQGGVGGNIVVTGTVAVVPVRSNTYVAVDGVKGTLLWRVKRPTPEGITMRGQATPVLDPAADRAYLGFSDGTLLGVSLSRGEIVWTAQIGRSSGQGFADVDADPVFSRDGQTLIAASYSGGLHGLDPSTGRVVWKKEQLTRITGMARAGAGGFIVASQGDGQVLGLDDEGRVHWRYKLKKGSPSDPAYLGRGLVAVGSSHGPLAILEERTGKPIQLVTTGSAGISTPVAWRDPDLAVFSNRGLLLVLRYGQGTGLSH